MASFRFKSSSSQNSSGGCGAVAFGLFWTLFSSIFFFLGLWLTVTDILRTSWPTAPCEIKRLEIIDDRAAEKPFSIAVEYSYRWEGKQYTNNKVWDSNNEKSDYKDLAEVLQSYQSGKLDTCHVNPENPADAVLFPTSDNLWGGLIFATVGGLFMAIGIGIMRSGRHEKKNAALSSKAKSEAGNAIIIPFFGVFACAGVGMLLFWILPMWGKYFAASSWQETPATVIWSHVRSHDSDDGTTYSADIFYRYQFRGKDYKSNSVGLMGGSSSGHSAKQEKVDAHPPGKTINCFVNPENPHEALLERELGWWAALSLFPLPFAGIGIGWLWYTLRKKGAARSEATSLRRASSSSISDYASPFSSSRKQQTYNPSKKRFLKALGIFCFAAFWNGIVSVMYFKAEGIPIWFLGIFMLVGAGVILAFVYQFLACFNPAPTLTIANDFTLGGSNHIAWKIPSGSHKLRHFAIYLVGEEEAKYRRGTNTAIDTSIFYEQAILDTQDPRQARRGEANIELPSTLMPSWKSDNNAIKWSLRVRGDIAFWPDIADDYDITVHPATSTLS